VRQRVLQTWGKLVEEICVPLSHWNSLLGQGELHNDSMIRTCYTHTYVLMTW
jgi:hypothetical protein